MKDFTIDSIANTSSVFPVPGSRMILVEDGWGSCDNDHCTILPASLLCCVMESAGKVEIPYLFSNRMIASGVLFKIPDHMELEYHSSRLRQTLKDGDRDVLEVFYDRSYNQIELRLVICGDEPEPPRLAYDSINGKCRYTEQQEWTSYKDAVIPEALLQTYWKEVRQALMASFKKTS